MTPQTKFDIALKPLLAHEGGYSNDQSDHGGKTRYGITLAVARAHGYQGDMQALPLDRAISIYKADYWNVRYDGFPQALATKLFDTAVNCGPGRAHILLQQALNTQGNRLSCDGMLGNATASAVLSADPTALMAAYREAQKQFYLALIANDATQARFKNGWLTRAAS